MESRKSRINVRLKGISPGKAMSQLQVPGAHRKGKAANADSDDEDAQSKMDES